MPASDDEPPSATAAASDVEIANEQDSLEVDEAAIRETIETLLRLEEVVSATISIAVVDDPTIHELNRRHLAHDYPTDVISFALHDEVAPSSTEVPRGRGKAIDAEVVVSADTAIRTAAEFAAETEAAGAECRWTAHDELLLYVVHGLLHVVGYDDRTAAERDLMRSREQAVLRERGLEPRYHEDDGPHGDDGSHDEAGPLESPALPAGRDEFGEDS